MTPSGGLDELVEVKHWHLACGSGGGAYGIQKGQARLGRLVARMRCLGGVDVDPVAIRDFTRLLGVPGTILDLFTAEQYVAFHGKAPPASWRPATVDDIRRSAQGLFPNLVFGSLPCKGFSGLLNNAAASSARYQALNGLTLHSVRLMLEAFAEDLPELFIFENVPRIQQRGRWLLDDIIHELRMVDYAVAETEHDCGEIGGLAQHRRRYLLVARNTKKVRPFLYEPPKKRVRAVGEVLGEMPLPDDCRAGTMHRSPRLEWRTWLRLALIPAGGDWRSLQTLDHASLRVQRVGGYRGDTLGIVPWSEASGTITGRGGPTNGAFAVQDPRPGNTADGGRRFTHVYQVVRWGEAAKAVTSATGNAQAAVADPRSGTEWAGGGKYRVTRMDEAAGAVIAESGTGNGAFAIADPRPPAAIVERDGHVYGVTDWSDPAETITAKGTASGPGSGRFSVADPRVEATWFGNAYRVTPWEDPAPTVTGHLSANSGGGVVADPRVDGDRFGNSLAVTPWEEPAPAVTGQPSPGNGGGVVADPRVEARGNAYGVLGWGDPVGVVVNVRAPGQGAFSVADPRWGGGAHGVVGWDEPAKTVRGESHPSNGPNAVADPRITSLGDHANKMRVESWEEPAHTVTTSDRVGSGAPSVADPRAVPAFQNLCRVEAWDGPAHTVVGATRPAGGALSVADPRVACKDVDGQFVTAGHYGVIAWGEPSYAVTGAACHDNGKWSVADPRPLPEDGDRPDPVPVIIALDGTWHRPFTTLELAALQSYPWRLFMEAPMAGTSDAKIREHVGNSVPPDAGEAIGSTMAYTLLLNRAGTSFMLRRSDEPPVWVDRIAIALSIGTEKETGLT